MYQLVEKRRHPAYFCQFGVTAYHFLDGWQAYPTLYRGRTSYDNRNALLLSSDKKIEIAELGLELPDTLVSDQVFASSTVGRIANHLVDLAYTHIRS